MPCRMRQFAETASCPPPPAGRQMKEGARANRARKGAYQACEGRAYVPVARTNCARERGMYPRRAPIAGGGGAHRQVGTR
eukprot:1195963-Prorocentrum_minimum.AAC.3